MLGRISWMLLLVLLFLVLLSGPAAAQLRVENNQQLFHPTGQGSFGASIAIADMDGDGLQDLVVGNPEKVFNGKFRDIPNVGEIAIIPNQQGQFPTDSFFWDRYIQSTGQQPNFIGRVDEDDFFGHAVATGDFNADGLADIAIGAPGDHFSVDGMPIMLSLGSITVGNQDDGGSSFVSQRVWRQAAPDVQSPATSIVPGNAEDGERFGWALAVGDFNGDGFDDLAVGVPGETLDGTANATGAVNVIFGRSGVGLDGDGAQFLHQATPGIVGAADVNLAVEAAVLRRPFDLAACHVVGDEGHEGLGRRGRRRCTFRGDAHWLPPSPPPACGAPVPAAGASDVSAPRSGVVSPLR